MRNTFDTAGDQDQGCSLTHRSGLGRTSFALIMLALGLLWLQGFVLTAGQGLVLALSSLMWLASMAIAVWAIVDNEGRRWAIAALIIGGTLIVALLVLAVSFWQRGELGF
jgi:hypothetical protein